MNHAGEAAGKGTTGPVPRSSRLARRHARRVAAGDLSFGELAHFYAARIRGAHLLRRFRRARTRGHSHG